VNHLGGFGRVVCSTKLLCRYFLIPQVYSMCNASTPNRTESSEVAEALERLRDHLDDKSIRLDSKGKLQLTRSLPIQLDPLPTELIPKAVLRLHERYQAGEVDSLPRAKYHSELARLRKYRLVPPGRPRTNKADMTPEERSEYNRAYLRAWRTRRSQPY
jgi:hypothetical protein